MDLTRGVPLPPPPPLQLVLSVRRAARASYARWLGVRRRLDLLQGLPVVGEAQRLARRREGRRAGGGAVGRLDQRAEVAGSQAASEARGRLYRAVLPNQTRQAVLRLVRVVVRVRDGV